MSSSGPTASHDFPVQPPHLSPPSDTKHMQSHSIPNDTPRVPQEPSPHAYTGDTSMDETSITGQAYQQPPPHSYPSNATYHSSSRGILPTDIRPGRLQPRESEDAIYESASMNGLKDDVARDPETPGRGGATPGLSPVFKVPPTSVGTPKMEEEAVSGSGSGSGKRKRRFDPPVNPSRASRARLSSPNHSNTPASSRSHEPSPIPPGGPLSIFAPPPPDALPEALQEVLGSSSSSRHADGADTPGVDSMTTIEKDKEGDVLMREADQGFNSRLRSKKSKEEVVVKTGVSASGKGVNVSGAVKEAGKARKKGKGRGDLDVPNQDFCSACRGIGKFLCCDGCPRSFHFMCLEPPFRVDELPQEETWYCKKCRAERSRETVSPVKDREPKPVPMVFKQLIKRIDEENPSQFRLPQDIRQFFSGVGTDSRGNYVDTEETRTKHDRKGFPDERDGNKLRDGRSKHVACYACGGTSMPNKSTATDPGVAWRQIVSCDYCALHWHLDCLNPPLPSLPPRGLKWMCPNHVEQVMTRRRTIRNNLETIDVEYQGLPNNGNITIMPDERGRDVLEYEDMIINKKKYRVPEKIIRLDFWNKIALIKGGKAPGKRRGSESSGLTSLASSPLIDNPTEADLTAANLILSFSHPKAVSTPLLGSTEAMAAVNGIRTPISAQQDPQGVDTPRRLVLKFNQPR